jgi:hypothetical protein
MSDASTMPPDPATELTFASIAKTLQRIQAGQSGQVLREIKDEQEAQDRFSLPFPVVAVTGGLELERAASATHLLSHALTRTCNQAGEGDTRGAQRHARFVETIAQAA